jgi:hypothetical protein
MGGGIHELSCGKHEDTSRPDWEPLKLPQQIDIRVTEVRSQKTIASWAGLLLEHKIGLELSQ